MTGVIYMLMRTLMYVLILPVLLISCSDNKKINPEKETKDRAEVNKAIQNDQVDSTDIYAIPLDTSEDEEELELQEFRDIQKQQLKKRSEEEKK